MKEMPEKNASVIYSTSWNHTAILCPGSNDIDSISEGVHYSLDGHITISVHSILYSPSAKMLSPVALQVIANILGIHIHFLVGSFIMVTNCMRHAYTPCKIVLFCF
jgi:hypothetical protein